MKKHTDSHFCECPSCERVANGLPPMSDDTPTADLADSVKAFRKLKADDKGVGKATDEFFRLFIDRRRFKGIFEALMEVSFCRGWDAAKLTQSIISLDRRNIMTSDSANSSGQNWPIKSESAKQLIEELEPLKQTAFDWAEIKTLRALVTEHATMLRLVRSVINNSGFTADDKDWVELLNLAARSESIYLTSESEQETNEA